LKIPFNRKYYQFIGPLQVFKLGVKIKSLSENIGFAGAFDPKIPNVPHEMT
jgi:hypothetical protein